MEDEREIYSIQDCIDIVEDQLRKQLGIKEDVSEAFCKSVKRDFRYTNWNRFKHANCPGCVSGPEDCDIAYGRKEHRGSWAKICNGKIQSCPARTNGTMVFSADEGIKNIDIADHKFNPIEMLEPIDESR